MNHVSSYIPNPRQKTGSYEPLDVVRVGTYIGPHKRKLDELDTSVHETMVLAIRTIHNWADRIRRGMVGSSLVFVGPSGTGKTHMATAIFWSMTQIATNEMGELIPENVVPVGRFYQADQIISEMDSTTRPGNMIRVSPYSDSCPLVVIDDIGTERTLPYVSDQEREIQNRYYRIIEHCYTWNVAMVLTSNLSLDGLRRVVGGRSWDRLQEMAPLGYMLDFAGVPSWREKTGGRIT